MLFAKGSSRGSAANLFLHDDANLLCSRVWVGEILPGCATLVVRTFTHDEADVAALQQPLVVQIVVGVLLAIKQHRLDIASFALAAKSHPMTVFKMECGFIQVGCAYHILVTARAYGIEPQCREHIPCRSLPVILVTTVAIGIEIFWKPYIVEKLW